MLVITIGRYCEVLGRFWTERGEMGSLETMAQWFVFAQGCLQLRHGLAPDVHSFVCRLREFSIEVRLWPSPVEIRDRPLNANAKVFTQTRGTKEPKDGKIRLENSTRKGEVRKIHEYKRKLSMMQAQVKEIQDKLDGKDGLDPCDFNWTPPSASEDTLCGLKTHILYLRRKKAKMCEVLENGSQVVSEDKETCPQVVSEDKETGKLKERILESMEEDDESKTEKFDEGRRGGTESEVTEADQKLAFLWNLQFLDDDEPREDILEKVGVTKEEWSRKFRIFRDDEPHDDDLKWLGISKRISLRQSGVLHA